MEQTAANFGLPDKMRELLEAQVQVLRASPALRLWTLQTACATRGSSIEYHDDIETFTSEDDLAERLSARSDESDHILWLDAKDDSPGVFRARGLSSFQLALLAETEPSLEEGGWAIVSMTKQPEMSAWFVYRSTPIESATAPYYFRVLSLYEGDDAIAELLRHPLKIYHPDLLAELTPKEVDAE